MESANWIIVALVLLGLLFLFLEIAIIPGVGLVGLLGLSCIIAACVVVGKTYGAIQAALLFGSSLMACLVFLFLLPKLPGMNRLMLKRRQTQGPGFEEEKNLLFSDLLDKSGIAITPLRPSGIAEIEGRRIDVMTEGEFIEARVSVRVVAVIGSKVVVEKVEETSKTG